MKDLIRKYYFLSVDHGHTDIQRKIVCIVCHCCYSRMWGLWGKSAIATTWLFPIEAFQKSKASQFIGSMGQIKHKSEPWEVTESCID